MCILFLLVTPLKLDWDRDLIFGVILPKVFVLLSFLIDWSQVLFNQKNESL